MYLGASAFGRFREIYRHNGIAKMFSRALNRQDLCDKYAKALKIHGGAVTKIVKPERKEWPPTPSAVVGTETCACCEQNAGVFREASGVYAACNSSAGEGSVASCTGCAGTGTTDCTAAKCALGYSLFNSAGFCCEDFRNEPSFDCTACMGAWQNQGPTCNYCMAKARKIGEQERWCKCWCPRCGC